MKPNVRDSWWFGHVAAFSATLVLGVAIAAAQNKVATQVDPKNPNARNPTAAGPAKPKGETHAGETAHARRGHVLGMTVEADKEQGLTISKVEDGGAAARAGLKENDRVVSADNHTFRRSRQFEAYLASHGGRQIPIVVLRDGQQKTVMYTPPSRAGDSAWLGVYLEDPEGDSKGAQITQVYPAGPAARAGLEPGDVITQVNGEKIESPADLIATIAGLSPQSKATFVILRNDNDEEQKLDITLGAHQAFAQQFAERQGADRQGPDRQGPDRQGADRQGAGDQQQFHGGNQPFDNVSPHVMQLEHDRRVAEQHERIENEIRALREEIRKLREELKDRK